jgi:hypothetical protein
MVYEILNDSLQAIAIIAHTVQMTIDNELEGQQWLVD